MPSKNQPPQPDYIGRIDGLVKAMAKSDYEIFDHDKEEALDTVQTWLQSFPAYANVVVSQQSTMPILQARYEGADYREAVARLDSQRKNYHEAAIASVGGLNRMSSMLGLEPFADIDVKDRHAVADFVGDYVGQLYQTGTRGMDGATLNRAGSYDVKAANSYVERAASIQAPSRPDDPEQGGPSL